MSKLDFDTYMTKITQMWLLLNKYTIEIGVFDSKSERQSKVVVNDISNAELMFIHENGSPLQNIPKRPVLEMSIQHALKKIVPIYLKTIEKQILDNELTVEELETLLGRMCMEIQSYAQDLIYKNDGRLARNAPSTIKGKPHIGNHPLFNTGQLARSIQCQLVKK